jgi:hypothetical protein
MLSHRNFLGATLLSLSLSIASQTAILACACKHGTIEEKVSSADCIFVGKCTNIQESKESHVVWGDTGSELSVTDIYIVSFEVTDSIKGPKESCLELITNVDTYGMCGYPFAIDSVYIVFADNRKQRIFKAYSDLPAEHPLIPPELMAEMNYSTSILPTWETSICYPNMRACDFEEYLKKVRNILKDMSNG